MKDRFGQLQDTLDKPGGRGGGGYTNKAFSTVDLDLDDLSAHLGSNHATVAPDNNPELNSILQEAQHVRQEIQQIQEDHAQLREQNYHALNNTLMDDTSEVIRDANNISADIKARGEAVLQRLHRMNKETRKLEVQRGSTNHVVRIARTQYTNLSTTFREVMFNYNETELGHRENCKRLIQRQMAIVGRDVTSEEVEEMMESGQQFNIFNALTDGKTAQSALTQIASRHKELLDLEKRIQGVQELFLDVAVLTEEQGAVLNNIETNVQKTEATIAGASVKLNKAKRYDKNNPIKKLFCCCFPCCK
ncbi:syntaxin-11-like [Coregonus clupeaformis]|uniref:syntaxin-11-like n=1 Tax=Coregonus clupeaformis TaxID=59861 RepID=UPI001BDFB08C|nr:syntaxin-11-like [Coregonus clupeaformis]